MRRLNQKRPAQLNLSQPGGRWVSHVPAGVRHTLTISPHRAGTQSLTGATLNLTAQEYRPHAVTRIKEINAILIQEGYNLELLSNDLSKPAHSTIQQIFKFFLQCICGNNESILSEKTFDLVGIPLTKLVRKAILLSTEYSVVSWTEFTPVSRRVLEILNYLHALAKASQVCTTWKKLEQAWLDKLSVSDKVIWEIEGFIASQLIKKSNSAQHILKKKVDVLNLKSQNRKQEIDDIERELDRKRKVQTIREASNHQHEELKAATVDLDKRLAEMDDELRMLQTQLESAEKEATSAKQELEQFITKAAGQGLTIEQVEQHVTEFKGQQLAVSRQRETNRELVVSLKTSRGDWQQGFHVARQRLSRILCERGDYSHKDSDIQVENLNSKLDEICSGKVEVLAQLQQELQDLEATNILFKAELNDIELHNTHSDRKLASLERQNQSLAEKITEIDDEITREREYQLQLGVDDITTLKGSIDNARREGSTLQTVYTQQQIDTQALWKDIQTAVVSKDTSLQRQMTECRTYYSSISSAASCLEEKNIASYKRIKTECESLRTISVAEDQKHAAYQKEFTSVTVDSLISFFVKDYEKCAEKRIEEL